ncbi:MAG: hypothetical protein U9Q40_01435, partial [Campylobacterota bacterium]|nr:hypothetical protein [Campylobacterota bacterium]
YLKDELQDEIFDNAYNFGLLDIHVDNNRNNSWNDTSVFENGEALYKHLVSQRKRLNSKEHLSNAERNSINNDIQKHAEALNLSIARRNLDSLVVPTKDLEPLAKKHGLEVSEVRKIYAESFGDQRRFKNKLANLIDRNNIDEQKKITSDRWDSGRNKTLSIDKFLTRGMSTKGLLAYYKNDLNGLDSKQKAKVKASLEIKSELLFKRENEQDIERIKAENNQELTLGDIFAGVGTEKLSRYEKSLLTSDTIVGEFKNKEKQEFYQKAAKVFNADLIIVSGGTNIRGSRNRSAYYPPTETENAKIVINARSPRSPNALFGDMLAAHITNSFTQVEKNALANSIRTMTTDQEGLSNGLDRLISKKKVKENNLDNIDDRVVGEVIGRLLTSPVFYKDLARSYEGRKAASNVLVSLIDYVDKLDKVVKTSAYYNKQDIVDSFTLEEFESLQKMFAGMVMGDEFVQRGKDYKNMSNSKPRLFSMGGFYSVAELEAGLETVKESKAAKKLKGDFNNITNGNDSIKVRIMDQVEKWIEEAKQMIKKYKPTGFIDDFLADQKSMELASIVNHGATMKVEEMTRSVIAKHKNVYDKYSEKELVGIHDRITKGFLLDENGEPTKKKLKPLDLSNKKDVDTALKEGLPQEIIDAFLDYKKESDLIHKELLKVYPDLPFNKFHYGQSIRWVKKDGNFVNDEFDRIIYPDKSSVEGSDHYTKERNMDLNSNQIAAKHKLRYRTINPNEMFLEYVHETQKLINTHEMANRAIAEGRGKLFYNYDDGVASGLHAVDDPAFQKTITKGMTTRYELLKDGMPLLDKEGKRTTYTSMQDAIVASEAHTDEVEVVTAGSSEKTLVGYTLFKQHKVLGLQELMTLKDIGYAKEEKAKLEKDGSEIVMQPIFEETKHAVVAQVFFEEDLAKMLRTIVSKDKFKSASMFGISGQKLLWAKNLSTTVEFAFSMFHAFTIAQETISSEAGHKVRNAVGFGNKIKAMNPYTAFKSGMRNASELKVIVEAVLADPTLAKDQAIIKRAGELLKIEEGADVYGLVKQYFAVGGLMAQDHDLRSGHHYYGQMKYGTDGTLEIVDGQAVVTKGDKSISSLSKTINSSIKDAHKNLNAKHPDNPTLNMLKTARFAALEGPSAWLMEFGIPKIKMAMWMKEYTANLTHNKEKLASGELTEMAIAHDTMKFVEDRMGEVNWKSQWMNNGTKSALIFLMRSFTWVTGSWKALSKAGIDIGKLGWFSVKNIGRDENQKTKIELNQKGWWGVNAIIAHIVTAQAVQLAYEAIAGAAGDEVPDDEETSLTTKLLFPRVDPSDPRQRVVIPSYVTELYKILHHIGLMGSHPEPSKLLSGRLNSLVLNAHDLWRGEDWRGVTVRDNHDNYLKQAVDITTHMLSIAPISVSSAIANYKRKGLDPISMVTSLGGLTKAPAVALHSPATNRAYQLSRSAYKGKSKEPAEMRLKEEISRAAYAYGKGNKEPLRKMLADGEINEIKFRNAKARLQYIDGKLNPAYKDELSSAINRLTILNAIDTWHYMSDAEKKKQRPLIIKKYSNVIDRKTRSSKELKQIHNEMKVSGIL